jgi:uncharacterized protein (TIGR02147 family)
MGKNQPSASDRLLDEYLRRKKNNPRYSLRAFARHMAIPSGPLSEILAKKRPLTSKQGDRLADRLGYSSDDRKAFLDQIEKERPVAGALKSLIAPRNIPDPYQQIQEDRFSLIADWYHFALLALLETTGCRNDPKWMARRLGIPVTQVRSALERLERLELLQRREGRYFPGGNLTE